MKIKINSFYIICAILAEIIIINLLIIVVLIRGTHAGTIHQKGTMPETVKKVTGSNSLPSEDVKGLKDSAAGKSKKSDNKSQNTAIEHTSILLKDYMERSLVINEEVRSLFETFENDLGIVKLQKQDYFTLEKQNFIATAYDLSYESCGKYPSDPAYGITFTGTRATKGRTVAVDPKVIPLGSRVYIEFPKEYSGMNGWYIAEDTGSKVRGNIIDIFLGRSATREAKLFGRRRVSVKVAFPLKQKDFK